MPSFDIVSEVDNHELGNAVDQTKRELGNRFDFKGVDFAIEQEGDNIKLVADAEFQVNQILDVLQNKMIKRGIDIGCLEKGDITPSGKQTYMIVTVKQGLDSETAKKIVKLIKAKKMKVQSAIQGDKVRVTGKKRDDLQAVMALLRGAEVGVPLQFNNFRD
ncbi:MAG TPA: YajQ family cyclic di-GMP-binding protein [Aeromonadales bacterium]|nr:YajQ family cyclic di-GMP-binding protein [Aeromonadales bacterium]